MGAIFAIIAMVKWLVDGDLTAAIVCLSVGLILKGVVTVSISSNKEEDDDFATRVWNKMRGI